MPNKKNDPFAAYQQPATSSDPFAAYQQPIADPNRPAGLPDGMDLPQLPDHPPVDMKPAGSVAQMAFGDRPLRNTGVVVGQHLKNFVAGPYNAFMTPPQTDEERGAQLNVGQAGLGAYRMFVQPSIGYGNEAVGDYKAGNYKAAGAHAMDALPVVGPYLRNNAKDAETYGEVPALFGAATDYYAPKGAAKLFSGATAATGRGTQLAGSTPETLKTASTRFLAPGSPGELLNRALKPGVNMPDFEQSIEATLPDIAKQNPKGVNGFADAAENVKSQSNNWYQNLKAKYLGDPIDTTPLVDAQVKSIPATDLFETPQILDSTLKRASAYDMRPRQVTTTSPILDEFGKPITRTETITPEKPSLDTVDKIRKDTNAKEQGFYETNSRSRNAALSNPGTARTIAVNRGTRNLVYNHLADQSGVPVDDIAKNQDLYGHASDVAEVAGKRATVAGRANPLSLQESLQLHGNPVSQAYNFATSRMFKNLTNSDALTNAAIDRFQNPAEPTLTPRNTVVGKGLFGTGTGLRAASKAAKSPGVKALFYAPLANPQR